MPTDQESRASVLGVVLRVVIHMPLLQSLRMMLVFRTASQLAAFPIKSLRKASGGELQDESLRLQRAT